MDADAEDDCPRFGGSSAAGKDAAAADEDAAAADEDAAAADEDAAAADEDAAAADEDAAAAESHFDGLSFARNSSRENGASQQWNDR